MRTTASGTPPLVIFGVGGLAREIFGWIKASARASREYPVAAFVADGLGPAGEYCGVPVVRRYDLMDRWLAMSILTRAQMQAPDGLHMSDAAYALLAKTVARAILADMAPLVAADSVLPKS